MSVVLYNKDTRETVTVDPDQARYKRMRSRIKSWAAAIGKAECSFIMITLTYKDANAWQPRDIRKFLNRWLMRYQEIIGYAWVMEMQKRGAPHYHVIIAVPKGFKFDAYPDLSGAWEKGMTRVETARSPYYLLKYTGKEYQKEFEKYPKGARLYATCIRRKKLHLIEFREYWKYRLSSLSGYYRDLFERLSSRLTDDDLKAMGWWKRPKGGGVKWDGARYRSPWRVIKFS
jgi:hypothetical protein